MQRGFNILIADRNPHVREFLKREMAAEGYRVRLAKSGREILSSLHGNEPFDLMIVDLDLPDVGELAILEEIQARTPRLPVIVHTFLSEYINHPTILSNVTLVEKKGTNIDSLKNVVLDVLQKAWPQRFEAQIQNIPNH